MWALLAAHPFIVAVVSMALATLSYVPLFGWRYAALMILVLLVHELGHMAAIWSLRLQVETLVFVPLLGAFVTYEQPRIVEHDAVIALSGPAAGALFAWGCAVAAVSTGDEDLGLLGATGALFNLLNLMPVPPLDGGRILAVISPSLCGAMRSDRDDRETIAFYAAPPVQRVCAVLTYLVTAAVLALSFKLADAVGA